MTSKFSQTLRSQFGLEETQQKAVLKIFTMSGYLKPEKIWDDLNRSKVFTDAESVFKKVYPIIYKAGAQNADPGQVNIDLLYNNLFGIEGTENGITPDQLGKFFLFQAQNAFARPHGRERSELLSLEWMQTYKTEFMDAAKPLGLIDRIEPHNKIYDEAWIAGASGPGVAARIVDSKWTIKTYGIKINGAVKVLAGERELWAEIDGINPMYLAQLNECYRQEKNIDDLSFTVPTQGDDGRIGQGIGYMLDLAHKHGIELVEGTPTIKYATKEECPVGRFPGRTYLNYKDPNGLKVTESLMSADMLEKYGVKEATIVDTKALGAQRPTTETTAKDAAEHLVQNALEGRYAKNQTLDGKILIHIFYQSNNPYIERQGIATQRVVNEVFDRKGLLDQYKPIVDYVGFGNKQDVVTIFSEFGADMYELYVLHGGHPESSLTYQYRDHTMDIPPMPDLTGLIADM